MQSEMSDAANQIFRQLNDADLKFGTIKNEKGELDRAQHTPRFRRSLHSPKRTVRKAASINTMPSSQAHENTLAATLAGSIQRDVYYAKARNYTGAGRLAVSRQRAGRGVRQPDRLGASPSCRRSYRYYDLRRRKMKLERHPSLRHLRADPQRTAKPGTPGTRP